MIDYLVFTDNKDYVDSFKSLTNNIQFGEIFSKEYADEDEEKALRVIEIKNLLREISYSTSLLTKFFSLSLV